MISRRALLAASVAVLAAPLAAHAQRPKAIPRIGVLGNDSESAEVFRQGLREVGYLEGHNIAVEYRWAAGRLDRLPELAAELIRLKVDLIVTMTHRVALVAKEATTTIPIVFTRVNDPIGVGLVPNLARPGANVTGVSLQGFDVIGKRLQLLHEVVPRLSRVAYLGDPTEPYWPGYLREVHAEAKALGLKHVLIFEVRAAGAFEGAFAELARERPDALLVEPNSLTLAHRQQIADVALAQRLPAMYAERRFMGTNGLMSFGTSLPDHFRRAAVYVDKILKGAKPADMPIEQPTTFEFVINLKTAKALGLTIPPSLLARADRVIE